MIDAVYDGASAAECDVDVVSERLFTGYRQKPSAPAVAVAEAALRSCGYEPRRIATGGGSDANALEVAGFTCVNLANGTERNHEPTERVSIAALEGMLDVALRAARRGGRAQRLTDWRAMSSRFERVDGETSTRARFFTRPQGRGSATRTARRPSARSSIHTGAVGDRRRSTASSCGSSASRARRSASRTCWRSRPASSTRRARSRSRPPSASWPRRSASRPSSWEPLGSLLHLARLHRRGGPPLPRHGHLRRRRAPRGRRERADRRRGPAARRPRRPDRRGARLEDDHRPRAPAREARPLSRDWREPPAVAALNAALHRQAHASAAANSGPWPSSHRTQPFEHLVLDFLAYLEFERGLSRNTLEAYRSDLLQFGAHLERTDARRADARARRARRLRRRARHRRRRPPAGRARHAPAQGRLPALLLPPPAPPGPAHRRPDRAPQGAAADPQAARRCSRATRSPGCSSSRAGTEPAALRDRALLEVMYACGLRASEATGLEVGDVDLEAGILRARGKGSKERLVPIGSDRRPRAGRLPAARPPAPGRRPARAAPVPQPPRRRPHPPGALQDRPAPRALGRAGLEDEPAHAAPHVRDPPAGRRLRPALAPGDARPRRHRDDPALHAPVRRPPQGRLLRRPPAGAARTTLPGLQNRGP